MNKLYYSLFLVLIVTISGCTIGGGTTKVELKKVLDIKTEISPSTVIMEGQSIVINTYITNIGQNEVSIKLNNNEDKDKLGRAILSDYCDGVFKIVNFQAYPASKSEDIEIKLKPEESLNLIWTLKSIKLGGYENPGCNLKFTYQYKAFAETQAYVYFVNPTEKIQRDYTNKDLKLRGNNLATYGPVSIYFTPLEEQPIMSGKKWLSEVKIINHDDGEVTMDSLKISSSVGLTENDNCKDKVKGIKVRGKEKFSIQCEFEAVNVQLLEPIRFILSGEYNYKKTENKKIKINTVYQNNKVEAPGTPDIDNILNIPVNIQGSA